MVAPAARAVAYDARVCGLLSSPRSITSGSVSLATRASMSTGMLLLGSSSLVTARLGGVQYASGAGGALGRPSAFGGLCTHAVAMEAAAKSTAQLATGGLKVMLLL